MNLKVLCASVSSFYASADLCWLTGSQTCRSFLPFALTLKNSWSDQFVSLFLFSFFFFFSNSPGWAPEEKTEV